MDSGTCNYSNPTTDVKYSGEVILIDPEDPDRHVWELNFALDGLTGEQPLNASATFVATNQIKGALVAPKPER